MHIVRVRFWRMFVIKASRRKRIGSAQPKQTGRKKQIYLLIQNRGDLSYWDSMAAGGEKAAKDFADKADVHIIETTADVQASLTCMYESADKGADMILTAGGDFRDNLVKVAKEYPDIAVVSMGTTASTSPATSMGLTSAPARRVF